MADGPSAVSLLDGLIKTQYDGQYITEQQMLAAPFLSTIPVHDKKPGASGLVFDVHLGGNMGGGPLNYDENFQRGQTELNAKATVGWTFYHWTIDTFGEVLDVVRGGDTSFAENLDYQMTEAVKSFHKLRNQDAYGDGTSVRAIVTANATSATHTVDNPHYLRRNMKVDIYDTTLATLKARGVSVVSNAVFSGTVTFDTSLTLVATDKIVLTTTQDNAPSTGKSLHGLARIIDTTTAGTSYLGISRSTYPEWQAVVHDAASAAAVSNDLLQRIWDRHQFTCDGMADTIHTGPQQLRAYLGTVTPLKEFHDDKLDSGYTALTWNGKPWRTDTDCPRDTIFFLTTKGEHNIRRAVVREMSWDDRGGGTLRRVGESDRWAATLICRDDLFCRRPNHQAKIKGLITPAI